MGKDMIPVSLERDLLYRIDTLVSRLNLLRVDAKVKGKKETRAGFIRRSSLQNMLYEEERIDHAFSLLMRRRKSNEKLEMERDKERSKDV